MKTDFGHYYILFSEEDFNEKFMKYTSKNYVWIYGTSEYPSIIKYPIILNCDFNHTMIWSYVQDKNFESKIFRDLYKKVLRKKKFKKIYSDNEKRN